MKRKKKKTTVITRTKIIYCTVPCFAVWTIESLLTIKYCIRDGLSLFVGCEQNWRPRPSLYLIDSFIFVGLPPFFFRSTLFIVIAIVISIIKFEVLLREENPQPHMFLSRSCCLCFFVCFFLLLWD